ncbi:MAG: ATP-binding protein [Turicibacter sp.]|nr:ATP-binding protein [Turicibacter sp.]
MGKKIPYGISHLESIRGKKEDFLYVDKTHFLKEIEKTRHLIHLRPRRFGKSLFLSMMESYYDINSADKFNDLFNGLSVHREPTPLKNSYYILRLNFSGIQNTESADVESGFTAKVVDGIRDFIGRYKLEITPKASTSASEVLSAFMTDFNELKLSHKIYILIDEYDHFTNALLKGSGEDFLAILQKGGFVRSFYEVLKEKAERGIVERMFITGVMSITLDSMTSGFNIATNITTNKKFTDIMGFTHDEVQLALTQKFEESCSLTPAEQSHIFEILKENYNGYRFSPESPVKIFNSTLIMYFLQNYLPGKEIPKKLVDDNLNQTGTTIANLVNLKNSHANLAVIEDVVKNKVVEGDLQPFIKVDEKFDTDDLITVLFNIGLLTIKGEGMSTYFEMPNKIIEKIYYDYLGKFLQKEADYTLDVSRQRKAITALGINGDVQPLTELVSDFLKHTSGRNSMNFDEKYVKLAYLFALSNTHQFTVYDEFPAQQGYGDIFIQKSPTSHSNYEFLIELTYIKKSDTTTAKIEQELSDGIDQIKYYIQDQRLALRENLKKFCIVFSHYEAVRVVEVH